MKKIRIIAALVLSLCLLGISAFAAEFTPSVEEKDGPEAVGGESVATIYDKDGNVVYNVPKGELVITPVSDKDNADDDIKNRLEDAQKDLNNNSLTDLVPDFANVWAGATGGAPISNAVVSDIFDVTLIGDSAAKFGTGNTIKFALDAQGIDKDDKFVVIMKPAGGTGWQVVDYTIDADGNIVINTDVLGVFAIVKDSGNVVIDPSAPSSPQTGIADYTIPVAFGVALFGACAVVFGKKAFEA